MGAPPVHSSTKGAVGTTPQATEPLSFSRCMCIIPHAFATMKILICFNLFSFVLETEPHCEAVFILTCSNPPDSASQVLRFFLSVSHVGQLLTSLKAVFYKGDMPFYTCGSAPLHVSCAWAAPCPCTHRTLAASQTKTPHPWGGKPCQLSLWHWQLTFCSFLWMRVESLREIYSVCLVPGWLTLLSLAHCLQESSTL